MTAKQGQREKKNKRCSFQSRGGSERTCPPQPEDPEAPGERKGAACWLGMLTASPGTGLSEPGSSTNTLSPLLSVSSPEK